VNGQGGGAALDGACCNFIGEAGNRSADRLGIEHDQQAAGGIVEDRFQAGMQQRLEVFDAVEVDGILQVGQDARRRSAPMSRSSQHCFRRGAISASTRPSAGSPARGAGPVPPAAAANAGKRSKARMVSDRVAERTRP